MIIVGTTLAAYVMDQQDTWAAWLYQAEKMADSIEDDVRFFAAIQTDGRGMRPFRPLLDRLNDIRGEWWIFSLDDGRTQVTTTNRLRHITMGQNLVFDRCAGDPGVTHCLFLAADLEPPADCLPKLLETFDEGFKIVGGEVTTYNLAPYGRIVEGNLPLLTWRNPETLIFSAAFVMVDREVFRRQRWRYDLDEGRSDDPCFQYDAWNNFHWPIVVRTDVVGRHYPEAIPGIEMRGHDRTIVR
jgi:hypothetical protein